MTVTMRNVITAEDRASSVFAKVGKSVDDLDRRQKAFAAGVAGAFSTAAVLSFAKDSVAAFAEAEAAQSKLERAYTKFPSMASANIGALREMNQALQDKTGADADSLAAAQASLAMFKLTGSQIRELTPLLVDYATVTGQDVESAATALGKAMTGNAKALKAIGINFKATGDTAADFATIMSGLQSKVGGAGEAFGQTTAGQLLIAQKSFEDLQEAVGEALVPALQGAADGMRTLADVTPDAMSDLVGMGTTVKTLTDNLQSLGKVGVPDWFKGWELPDWWGDASGGGVVGIGLASENLGWLKQAIDGANGAGDRLTARMEAMGYTLDKNTGQFVMATAGGDGFGASLGRVASATDRVKASFAGLLGVLSRQDAIDGQAQAMNRLAQSVKDNGKSFSGTSAKALENREALRGAMKATADLAASYQGADAKAAVLRSGVAKMRATLAASGLSQAEINKLLAPYQQQIDKLGRLRAAASAPIVVRTVFTSTGTPAHPQAGANQQSRGGYIAGPGTGTSDSIPAWLSDGEYVVKAAAVRKYGAHLFDRLNTMSFASGGKVKGKAKPPTASQLAAATMKADRQRAATIAKAQKVERQLMRLGLSADSLDRLEGMDPAQRLATATMLARGGRKAVRQFNGVSTGLNADRNRQNAIQAAEDRRTQAEQQAQQDEDARTQAAQRFADAANQSSQRFQSFGAISGFDVNGAASATQALADAETALFEARRKANQTGSADDLRAVADAEARVGQARQDAAKKAVTAANILDSMRSRGANLARFRSVIERLKAAGLNQQSLSEILAMGPTDGTTIGEALLQGGPSAVTEANTLQSQIRAESDRLGVIDAAIQFADSPSVTSRIESYTNTPGGGQTVTVQLVLDGQVLQTSLLRLKRERGGTLGLS